jgi:hypothetical protein
MREVSHDLRGMCVLRTLCVAVPAMRHRADAQSDSANGIAASAAPTSRKYDQAPLWGAMEAATLSWLR